MPQCGIQLAKIYKGKQRKKRGIIREKTATANRTHVDPVCGMEVDPGITRLVANYQGHSLKRTPLTEDFQGEPSTEATRVKRVEQ